MDRGKPKGLPKSGGRKKGTLNKKTLEGKQLFEDLFFGDKEQIEKSFDKLSDREKFDVMAKFAPYVFPKLSSTESKLSFDVGAMSDEQIDRQFDRIIKNSNDG